MRHLRALLRAGGSRDGTQCKPDRSVSGTKREKPKRLPVSEELRVWIERHVDSNRPTREVVYARDTGTGRLSCWLAEKRDVY
jgi:hypothetical protein